MVKKHVRNGICSLIVVKAFRRELELGILEFQCDCGLYAYQAIFDELLITNTYAEDASHWFDV